MCRFFLYNKDTQLERLPPNCGRKPRAPSSEIGCVGGERLKLLRNDGPLCSWRENVITPTDLKVQKRKVAIGFKLLKTKSFCESFLTLTIFNLILLRDRDLFWEPTSSYPRCQSLVKEPRAFAPRGAPAPWHKELEHLIMLLFRK